jgi:hypothetical protein
MVKGTPFANVQGYSNPTADDLWAKAGATMDGAERQKLYSELQKILVNDVANANLFEIEFPTLYRKNVKNLVTTAIGLNESFDNVSIEKNDRRRYRALADCRRRAVLKVRCAEVIVSFLSFLMSRLAKALVVVIGVVVINFFLIRMAPGDPATVMAGEAGAGDAAYVTQLREQFGLDKPVLTQLGIYLKGVATLDLGYSYRNHLPVLDLILDRLPATFLLMSGAFVFSIAMGVLLGVISARTRYENRRRWIDSAVMSGALLLYATPLFWLSLMAIILFSVVLGWLPAFGMETVGANLTGLARARISRCIWSCRRSRWAASSWPCMCG